MRAFKLMVPAAILMAGFVVCTMTSYGKQEYAKKEGKSCITCHGKMEGKEAMAKNLNDDRQVLRAERPLAGEVQSSREEVSLTGPRKSQSD